MTDSTRFREQLARLGLSQRAAARALELDPRLVRRYAAGQVTIPRTVWLALDALAAASRSP